MKMIDIIKPELYDRFQCKGSACRRTCCAGWKITVSKSEYQDLKNKLDHTGTKTLQRMPEESRSTLVYGEFVLDEKGCPLQSDEGLCRLQLSFGAESLPHVCAFFPRQGIRCDDELQLSLTPACERVLELLLEGDKSLEFIRQKASFSSKPILRFTGKDAKTRWNHYIRIQEFCILLLQAKDISLDRRMSLLGLGLHQINAYYKNEEIYKVSGYIDRYFAMLNNSENIDNWFSSKTIDPAILLGNFVTSKVSSEGYGELLKRVLQELKVTVQLKEKTGDTSFTYSREEYKRRRKLFQARFTEKHPYFLENVMVMLFVGKHWASLPDDSCSIWDQYMYACWVYSNLKFVLTACIKEDMEDEELLDICVILLRGWIHNERSKQEAIKNFHETGSDTPAHMAMLVQAG